MKEEMYPTDFIVTLEIPLHKKLGVSYGYMQTNMHIIENQKVELARFGSTALVIPLVGLPDGYLVTNYNTSSKIFKASHGVPDQKDEDIDQKQEK